MRILVIGGTGMLGHKLIQVLNTDFDVFTTVQTTLENFKKYNFASADKVFEKTNIIDFDKILGIIREIKPDFVINAVGVIKQVEDGKNFEKLFEINAIFPQRLARVAVDLGFKLITVSTDCVFNGKKGGYTESDTSDAEDFYGKSKFLGEVFGENCLTLRTSIIGRELSSKHSLIEWFLSQKGIVKGFRNAIYSGFPTLVFAEIINSIIKNFPELNGLYHISSEPISKYELLQLARKNYQNEVEIEAFDDFYIDRSLDSSKFRDLTGFKPLPWDEMIKIMADDPTPYEEWRKEIS